MKKQPSPSKAGKKTLGSDKTPNNISQSKAGSFRESANFYKQLVESLEDYCVFSTDKNGIINSWNSGAEKIFGYTQKAILGKPAEILYTAPDRKEGMPEQEMKIAKRKGRATNERWHVRKDKSRFWGSGMVFPLKDENQKFLGFTKIMRDLTEKKTEETELLDNQVLSNNLFNSSPDCLKILDLDFNLLEMNEPGKKLMEVDDFSRFYGKCWLNFWKGDHYKSALKAVADAKKGKVGHFEGFATTAKDTPKYWEVMVMPIYTVEGKMKHILSISKDISGIKAEEEVKKQLISELELEKNRLIDVFEQAPAFLAILKGKNHEFEMVNKAYYQLVGHRDILGRPVAESIPEIKSQGFIKLLDSVYKTGKPFIGKELKAMLQRTPEAELEERFINLVYQPSKNANGKITGIVAHGYDVSEQVISRKIVEESEKRFRNLVLEAPMATALYVGKEMSIGLANPAMLKLWGKTEKVIGKRLRDALPELVGQPFLELLDNVYTTGVTFQSDETRADLFVDGKLQSYWFNFTYKPLFNTEGEVYAILNMAVEITKQVQIKKQLAEAEEQLRIAMEAGELGTWSVDPFTNIVKLDERCKELYGMSKGAKTTYKEILKQVHEEDIVHVELAIKKALDPSAGGNYEIEFRTNNKLNGRVRWIRCKGKAYFNEEKVAYRFAGTSQDITDQKLLLRQKDDFLGIASHELKTPVTSIKAYGQVLQSMFIKKGEVKAAEMLGKMDGQINKLTNLIGDLLDVTKIQSGKLQLNETLFDFNELVNDMIDDLQRTTQKHRIEKDFGKLKQVYGDKDRLGQVFVNLISNAIKYSPHTDRIIVYTQLEGENVTVCVKDFGVGIAPENQEKVFEQFYRVSGDKQHTFPGLGLGLYISSEIIKREDGRIWVESSEGQGSTFCFSIPVDRRKHQNKKNKLSQHKN